jgi:hypothetical protein
MASRRHKRKGGWKPLVVSLSLSAAMLVAGMIWVEGMTAGTLHRRLIWPLARLLFFIGVGLLAGQIIESAGWTRSLAVLARPFFRFGNLGNRCSAAFTAAFFSGVTANAMLLDYYKENRISRGQLFLTNFVNQLPAYFLHLPTTFFIVIPLTGWAGALYFLLTFLATLSRTALFLLYGHLHPEMMISDEDGAMPDPEAHGKPKTQSVWDGVRRKLPPRLAAIARYVVPIYIFIYLINVMGFFQWAQDWLSGAVVSAFMPVEALSMVILSFAAEFTSGFAAAGALMDAGVLSVKQTVMALLIGNIVAFPIRAVRHQLPRYMGIFSPKMGTQILLMGQGFRVASIVLVGAAYFAVA